MFPLSFPTVYVALISGATTRTTPHRRAYGAISRGPLLTGEHIGGHFSRGRIPDRPRIGVSDPASRDPGTERRYVTALGGELEVVAVFDNKRIALKGV